MSASRGIRRGCGPALIWTGPDGVTRMSFAPHLMSDTHNERVRAAIKALRAEYAATARRWLIKDGNAQSVDLR